MLRLSRILALILPLLLMTVGCAEESAAPEEPEDALQEEADRREGAEEGEVEVIDDERSVERRIRDASTAAKIRTALVEADELQVFNFDPVVVNGRVMLRGEVQTQEQRRRAESIAENVDGVRGVINEVSATEEPTPDEPDSAARDSMIAQMEADAAARETTSADTGEASAAGESAPAAASAQEEPEDSATYHTVRSGESLWTIARANGVTIAQIRQLNGLGSSSNIKPGQRLRVK